MDTRPEIKIDLTEYGGNGEVVIGQPSLRAKVNLKNALSNSMKIAKGNEGVQLMDNPNAGDVELIILLSYVRRAPFPTTLNGFLNYCDQMDAKNPGSDVALCEAMQNAVNEITQGDKSPLDN